MLEEASAGFPLVMGGGKTGLEELLAVMPSDELCMEWAAPIQSLDGGMPCLAALLSALDALCRATGRQSAGMGEAREELESCAVSSEGDASAARAECESWAEDVCARSWLAIHQGQWREVDPAWRDTYSVGCVIRAATHLWQVPGGSADAGADAPPRKKRRCEDGGRGSGGAEGEGFGEEGEGAGAPSGKVVGEAAGGGQWWGEEEEAGESTEGTALRWLDLALIVGGSKVRGAIHKASPLPSGRIWMLPTVFGETVLL